MPSPFARHVLPAEKITAIEDCVSRGLSVNKTALAVGCNRKTVMTYRRQWIEQQLQRAYDHLWDGEAEEYDAIVAKLPTKDVLEMADAWLDDQDDKTPPHERSKWHSR